MAVATLVKYLSERTLLERGGRHGRCPLFGTDYVRPMVHDFQDTHERTPSDLAITGALI